LDKIQEFGTKENGKLLPIILAGDMNSMPDSPPYEIITSHNLASKIPNAFSKTKVALTFDYGSCTKFLMDMPLIRIAKWLRILGVNAAVFDSKIGISALFKKASEERRVILTSSKAILQSKECPRNAYFVTANNRIGALVHIVSLFNLKLDPEKFLTGNITAFSLASLIK